MLLFWLPEIELLSCTRCLKPLLQTLRASFVSGNNYERLVNTCDKLRSVYQCMDRIKKCQPNHLFRVFTDGLKYMCVEHPDDCMQQCNAHKLVVGWFTYLVMRSTTFIRLGEGNLPPRVNSIFFRKVSTEACTLVFTTNQSRKRTVLKKYLKHVHICCYFLCLKTKYNSRCFGVGGNLLLVRITALQAWCNLLCSSSRC
uniref:CPG4 domain-containing protein n=1 Tax=Gongylonema pulchrum TaxID=637853 RepID=A0A183CYH9_9BILA